tara:strand:- start:1527 stop:2057 length:531 start_codon:yes stop_codon:yes gene_type:complete
MSKVIVECATCGKQFERAKKEVTRNKKVGRATYCSRSCSGKANQHSLREHHGRGRPELLVAGNRRTPQTPFKWFMRNVNNRNKEVDIDIDYIMELWDKQKGTCPFTGWKLELPKNSSAFAEDHPKSRRASLDRIDSNKGYVKGNVRFISVMANFCKNNFEDDEVRLFCEAVTTYGR